MEQKTNRADFTKRPENPTSEKDQRHRQRHIEVGISASEKGLIDFEAFGGLVSPTDGTETWQQTQPVAEQNENENGREKPESPFDEVMANDAFEEVMQAFDHPFPEVLGACRDLFHVPRGYLGENDESQRYNPRDHHGISDGKPKRTGNFNRTLRQTMLHVSGGGSLRLRGTLCAPPQHGRAT